MEGKLNNKKFKIFSPANFLSVHAIDDTGSNLINKIRTVQYWIPKRNQDYFLFCGHVANYYFLHNE